VESAPQPHHKTPKGAPQFSDLSPASTLPVLFRVTDGKSKEHRSDKVKIATVVEPGDLDGFFVRYAEVCRAGMDALKKRDRSKGKKRKKDKKSKDGGPSKT
jgi:signal recognition particle subunit SRP14